MVEKERKRVMACFRCLPLLGLAWPVIALPLPPQASIKVAPSSAAPSASSESSDPSTAPHSLGRNELLQRVNATQMQMQMDRLQLKQDRQALEVLRPTGNKTKIEAANLKVRDSLAKFNNSQANWHDAQKLLSQWDKPTNDAARLNGKLIREKRNQQKEARIVEHEQEQRHRVQAQAQAQIEKNALHAEKKLQKQERDIAKANAEPIRQAQQQQKQTNQLMREESAQLRELRDNERKAARQKIEKVEKKEKPDKTIKTVEPKITPIKRWYEFW